MSYKKCVVERDYFKKSTKEYKNSKRRNESESNHFRTNWEETINLVQMQEEISSMRVIWMPQVNRETAKTYA